MVVILDTVYQNGVRSPSRSCVMIQMDALRAHGTYDKLRIPSVHGYDRGVSLSCPDNASRDARDLAVIILL